MYRDSRLALDQGMICHYSGLQPNIQIINKNNRKERVVNSFDSMCVRYKELTGIIHPSILYKSMVDDRHRILITRWRLSCHDLFIETGRYKVPPITRADRTCKVCGVLEDELHALFICSAHCSSLEKLCTRFYDHMIVF